MTRNAVQAFQLLLIVLVFVGGGAWCVTEVRPLVLWALRIGVPFVGIAAGILFYRLSHRPDTLPDLLREAAGRYFEQDGFCFAPQFETPNADLRLKIYFQNRYAGHASAKVKILPPLKTLGFGRHPLPTIEVNVECPGGAFGVCAVRFVVPAKYQGKRMSFDLGADVKYPGRRGKLLRFAAGKSVQSTAETGRHGWGLIGAMRIAAQAHAKLCLPKDLGNELSSPGVETEILWVPEAPTGGFPVLPAKTAA